MSRRSGLGKGLDALIPRGAASNHDSVLRELPLSSIRPNPYQPRASFDEETLTSLAASIRELGVLQPVLVRSVDDHDFELIAGERRWRAASQAGLQSIPALVQVATDESSLKQALVENLHREDLNPLEEAAAYQQLIEDFGLTHEELGRRVGKSRVAITNTLRLFQLPAEVQRFIAEGLLDAGHGRALLGSPDQAFQRALAGRAVEKGLSVRAVEQEVRARLERPSPPTSPSAPAAVGKVAAPALLELEELLAEHLDTKVRVEMSSRRGRITIDFATLEDLERIYRAMTEPR